MNLSATQNFLPGANAINTALDQHAIVSIADARGNITYVNDKFCRVSGYTRDELIGQNHRLLKSGVHDAKLYDDLWLTISSGQTWQGELCNRNKSGGLYWVQTTIVPSLDANGLPCQYISMRTEITQIKKIEAELAKSKVELEERVKERTADLLEQMEARRENELRLSQLTENIRDAFWITDPNKDKLLYISSAYEKIWGRSIQSLYDSPQGWLESIHVEDRQRVQAKKTKQAAGLYNEEYRIVRPDGDVRWIHDKAFPVRDSGGTIYRIVGVAEDITEQKQQEEQVRQILVEKETILANVMAGIAYLKQRRIVSCNRRFEEIFQYEPDELIGKSTELLYDSPETFESIGALAYKIRAEDDDFTEELRLRHKDGSLFWGKLAGKPLDPAHPNEGSIWVYSDISERKQVEEQLRIAAITFESQESIMITDADRVILRVNQAFTNTTGYTAEEIVGQSPRILHSGRHDEAFYATMWETVHRTGHWEGEVWDKRKNGEIYPTQLSITAVKASDGIITHYVGSHTDISERKAAQERIRNLAFFDSLTGIPSRQLFLDRLQHGLASIARSHREGAILFIDLDYFKTINDTLGHHIGDLLLQQVAQRLTACMRKGDTVARLGGDEFVVLLEELSEHPEEAATQAKAIAEEIRAALDQPYLLDSHEIRSTASIGIALIGNPEQEAEELLKQADIAMYQSKKAGRNTSNFFDPQMQKDISARAALEAELRKAIKRQEFKLYYQIQMDNWGRACGAEALIRWAHPKRGLVSPLQFIPLAEEIGLILPIGLWVLETACAQLVRWATQPSMACLSLAVNINAQQLHQADFVEQVLAVLSKTGANPRRLKLELTESVLIDQVESTITKMTTLKAHGISFAIDDFGTGYSSLSYLKRLPLDQLKIAQGFVEGLPSDPNDVAIAKMVIALAESLGLDVMAEGVETEVQRDFLASCGCDAYQGYLFGKPVPIDQFEAALKQV